jgi:hypothetical protein
MSELQAAWIVGGLGFMCFVGAFFLQRYAQTTIDEMREVSAELAQTNQEFSDGLVMFKSGDEDAAIELLGRAQKRRKPTPIGADATDGGVE